MVFYHLRRGLQPVIHMDGTMCGNKIYLLTSASTVYCCKRRVAQGISLDIPLKLKHLSIFYHRGRVRLRFFCEGLIVNYS